MVLLQMAFGVEPKVHPKFRCFITTRQEMSKLDFRPILLCKQQKNLLTNI